MAEWTPPHFNFGHDDLARSGAYFGRSERVLQGDGR